MHLNLIIDSKYNPKEIRDLVFKNEEAWVGSFDVDLWDILIAFKLFPSLSQIRKDPKWSKLREIPQGCTEYCIGKLKHQIRIVKL